MNNRFAGALVVLLIAAVPVFGGVVSINGDSIVFDAGSGEVNTLILNPRGSAFDQNSGQFVTGVTIKDNGTSLPTAVAPCRVLAGTAICEGTGIFRAVIRLGNQNDSLRYEFASFEDPVVTMNVDGGLGDDTITGGPGADTLDGGAGTDTINGEDGNDRITGGVGNDTINGGRGTDHLFGNLGGDVINGDADNDEIDGGVGDDTIDGGQGADVIRGDSGVDRIASKDGFVDNINCGLGKDVLTRDGNDTVKRCE
jgi:Ca2+-binding RTX toxin-like protein